MSNLYANVKDFFDLIRLLLRGKQFMIGDVIEQYGSFRLHRYAIGLKSGRLSTYPNYWIVVGDLRVPLFLSVREYSVIKERQGPFRHCVSVGEIPVSRSGPSYLYLHVDRWLKRRETEIACCAEQVVDATAATTANLHRAEFYRKRIVRTEEEHRIVNDALREFLLEYPMASSGIKRNIMKEEREMRHYRTKLRRIFRIANKALLK